jgi:cobalamin-dependent methionine synthase I
MAFSGERINGLQPKGYKFFRERDKEENQRLAKEQAEAGASCLDLNAGTAWLRPAEVMVYPVKTVPKVMDTPLSPWTAGSWMWSLRVCRRASAPS